MHLFMLQRTPPGGNSYFSAAKFLYELWVEREMAASTSAINGALSLTL